mmetsp:Transcript_3397/g.8425  ORF Transcript_3397/g.8425 Transcript_3397/m.8425 type:complete len:171 (+) Transcript_3397:312-824(+)|eukprot:CAMPEP_0198235700 /NCGR_PEP_ID=MMETSP1446-20131203/1599_1 /TAXON_ID=1461542 ORGANISM="Unidentified sp, Strain CCMP2111" /NCGR_SAMPLE_ID=MMETSP1446 /ASSEMBLY_ACC=CAM_ASM_001112 /LENGTH=170 /DNA_ID=CAMNT_0043917037 /DNA_START=138 /DNA_END=650 /DNA_ORIENTATION=+
MRAVVQRVLSARVDVDGQTVSSIGHGLLCLVGLQTGDGEVDAEYICRKILNGRWFHNTSKTHPGDGNNDGHDGEKKYGTSKPWDLSVRDLDYEVLLVSQFTLCHKFKGNKPDFRGAMAPGEARGAYGSLVRRVAAAYAEDKVKDGVFGAMMEVHLVNDGPVTVIIDSNDK